MQKNKRKFKVKVFLILLTAAMVFVCVSYYRNTISPLVAQTAEAEVKALASRIINESTLKLKNYQAFYDAFYTYEKNDVGEITLVRANTASINLMTLCAKEAVQNGLDSLSDGKVNIPVGAFSGLALLADKGSDVKINVVQVGTADAKINSYYYNEGVNQTLHRLVLRITATVRMLIPLKAEDVEIVTDIVLAEDIVVGRVPDSYITGISDDNIFDLLP